MLSCKDKLLINWDVHITQQFFNGPLPLSLYCHVLFVKFGQTHGELKTRTTLCTFVQSDTIVKLRILTGSCIRIKKFKKLNLRKDNACQ